MPGSENTVSVTSAAVIEPIASGPSTEITGSRAGLSACRSTTIRVGRPLARAVRIKLLCMTSIRLPRITRAMVATLMNVSSAIGRTMKRGAKASQPPAGSQCSEIANTSTRTGPITNDGNTLPRLPTSITA